MVAVNNSSLISIIIPIYNSEKFINRCLNSVTKQTHKN
ncbi:glycosyltransferase family A protein, partial [Bifidobacterium aquikefiri]